MILYYSGTGNSRHIAHLLAHSLGNTDRVIDLCNMRHATTLHCPERRLIWVFPVYAWSLPPIVADFITGVRLVGHPRHYMCATCGDDIGLTAEVWRHAISARGWRAATAYSVQMPNTYVFMKGFDIDKPQLRDAKLSAAPAAVAEIARRIALNIAGDIVTPGAFAWVKTRLINRLFVKRYMSPKGFSAGDACNACGLCAHSCPTANITIADGKPRWGDDCAFCTRCYQICPHHAIDHDHSAAKKGQYRHFLAPGK